MVRIWQPDHVSRGYAGFEGFRLGTRQGKRSGCNRRAHRRVVPISGKRRIGMNGVKTEMSGSAYWSLFVIARTKCTEEQGRARLWVD